MNFYFLSLNKIKKSTFIIKQMTKELNNRFFRYLDFIKFKFKLYEESFGLQQSFSFFILNKKVYYTYTYSILASYGFNQICGKFCK